MSGGSGSGGGGGAGGLVAQVGELRKLQTEIQKLTSQKFHAEESSVPTPSLSLSLPFSPSLPSLTLSIFTSFMSVCIHAVLIAACNPKKIIIVITDQCLNYFQQNIIIIPEVEVLQKELATATKDIAKYRSCGPLFFF